jgi:phytoene synthase
MRLLEPARRQAQYALYAFCREVDDIADDWPDADKQPGLDAWREDVARIYRGEAPLNPLAQALVEPVRAYGLQQKDFLAVIEGCAMDAGAPIRRPSLAVLDRYCDGVAAAVGRLSVRVFGDYRPRSDDVADALGRALQFTNICRDVEDDAALGRLYLPDELLSAHGVEGSDPLVVLKHPNLPLVRRDLGRMAREQFAKAKAAMAECSPKAMRPAKLMGAMYLAILDKLEATGFALTGTRVRVPGRVKLWYAIRHGLL